MAEGDRLEYKIGSFAHLLSKTRASLLSKMVGSVPLEGPTELGSVATTAMLSFALFGQRFQRIVD